MFENTAFKITTGKLAATPLIPGSVFFPGSLLVIGGIVIWKLWRQQEQLQAQTSELSNELKAIKKKIAGIEQVKRAKTESAAPLSSNLKNIIQRYLPKSESK
ncbi:MAG: hypothetical protein DSY80_05700 [Desulfocapsa sp.]|nr:MAG: hypothetical protein DSY80_05700 [Desulfocapsa sp.]